KAIEGPGNRPAQDKADREEEGQGMPRGIGGPFGKASKQGGRGHRVLRDKAFVHRLRGRRSRFSSALQGARCSSGGVLPWRPRGFASLLSRAAATSAQCWLRRSSGLTS